MTNELAARLNEGDKPTQWPIKRWHCWYIVQTQTGDDLSFHRTQSGALRARLKLIEEASWK